MPNIQRYQSGMYICVANNDVDPAVNRPIEIKVQCKKTFFIFELESFSLCSDPTIVVR